ncbi:MAG: hypothetical protein V1835_05895, partial [Candidatus Micrarchaeota archaeon]
SQCFFSELGHRWQFSFQNSFLWRVISASPERQSFLRLTTYQNAIPLKSSTFWQIVGIARNSAAALSHPEYRRW